MSLTFPEWWDGGFPDIELVCREILKPALAVVTPSPDVVSWLPENYKTYIPIVSVARLPGEPDEDNREDNPQVLVSCICETRADSWELAEYVRQILLSYSKGTSSVPLPNGRVALVTGVRETEGPMLSPLSDVDERIVPMTFLISTKRNSTDYARVRKTQL